jgi:NAD(P)-dependent dehydrogenase (short-subunit alcohol dehydrogenase family)
MASSSPVTRNSILLIGASRGLGLAMAGEFVARGWDVVGTVRGEARTALQDLAEAHPGRVAVEQLDVTRPDEIAALRDRLAGRVFNMLFVNAGTANQGEALAQVSTDEFVRLMVTNALSPLRVVEGLQDLVPAEGLIGIMSSGQGSVSNNEKGGNDAYRASKAALNQLTRSYAARHAGVPRALVLMVPGWVRTRLGGPNAPFGIEDSIPKVVDVLLAQQGKPGLHYLDRDGRTVPW